jgi:Zn finger protein HypA/HybF involved in hydrogenase expression
MWEVICQDCMWNQEYAEYPAHLTECPMCGSERIILDDEG